MSARRIIPAALAALTTAALAATPAGAHIARLRTSFTPGGVNYPAAVAVDRATGSVYVASYPALGQAVEKFSGSGAFEPSFPPLSIKTLALAVDNSGGASQGDLYLSKGSEVVKLDSSGKEVAGFTPLAASSIPAGDVGSEGIGPGGVAVDPANGNVVVVDAAHGEVDIFSSSGVFVSQFASGESGPAAGGVAVGPGSVIFTGSSAAVQEWSPADGYSTPTTVGPGAEFLQAVAADASTGHLFADENSQIAEYDSAGNPLLHFGAGELSLSLGVAVNEATDTVYVSDALGQVVDVYGPSVVLADVTTGTPASNVTSTTADVSGTVNPVETTVTGCRFEYGLEASYGATSACSPPPPLTGNAPVAEAASLAGLQPNATYHYRLVAVNGNGPSYGEDQTFTTSPAAPSLDDQSVSALTQTSVILDASVNPNNQETTYHFEVGSSAAYGTTLPAPDGNVGAGYGDVVVGRQLTGLTPGTTYHFRVVATNEAGVSKGVDRTFTTPPLKPPLAATGAAGGVSSSTATLSGTVDPQGVQSTYEFDLGVDTGYGTRIFGEAGSGVGPQSFSVSLSELTPGTTYHYRLVAMNVFGTSYGPDETFTTPAVPGALLVAPAGTPLIPAPPFPEQAAGTPTAKAAAAARARKAARARASRSAAKRRGKHARPALGARRTGHAHNNGRGGR